MTIPLSPVHTSWKNVPSPVDVKNEVTEIAIALYISMFEITGMPARVIKFGFAYYCHKDLLLMVNETNDPEVLPRNITHYRVLFIVQSFRTYGFDHT